MDETYIRVGGRWCYFCRAITAGGQTLDFYLSPKRNVAAAKRFLAKALRSNASAGYPRVINTDKSPSLARAIAELKSEGICPPTVEHRQAKYLNNILEGDHGRLKRILGPKGAFKNRTSAYRTLKGMGGRCTHCGKGKARCLPTGNRTRTRGSSTGSSRWPNNAHTQRPSGNEKLSLRCSPPNFATAPIKLTLRILRVRFYDPVQ